MIITKLTYGLETLQYHQNTFHRIDTFQMKGLRKILWLEPTFIDRSPENTNEAVVEKVNNILTENGTRTDVMKVRKLSEVIELRRKTFLGHVIRSPEDDPMKRVTFDSENQNLKPLDMG